MIKTTTTFAFIAIQLVTAIAAASEARQRIEADIRFLSDDLLEGRGTPGRGLDTAALYLAESLRAAGFEPGVGDSYFQEYRVGEYKPADTAFTVTLGGTGLSEDEFIMNPWGLSPQRSPLEASLVFAGLGVVDVTQGMDPYGDMELKGKAVVAVLGAPWELDPQAPFGYDRAVGKSIEATVRNAEVLVYVSEELSPDSDSPSGEAVLINEMAMAPVAYLVDASIGPTMGLGPVVAISPAAFDRALGDSVGSTYAGIRERGENGPARELNAKLELTISTEASVGQASNVIGLLRGTDPELADEWIVLSAHYDHLGMNPAAAEGEDGVWNGADDNASGTAALLEIARRLGEEPPARSVAVMFFSGEDRGILGSAYYAHNAVIPYSDIVVDVNVDMVGRSTGSVQGIVTGSAGLFEKARSIGEEIGITVVPDQQPTWRLAYLTDSYHFDRFDVPAIHFFTGLHADYHQPSDEADKIRFEELGRILDIMYLLTQHYAEGGDRPDYRRPQWFLTPD
jgi:hypothetical protein